MSILIPLNKKRGETLTRSGDFDLFNVLDDFFSDNLLPVRNLQRDTFKIDIKEEETKFLIEAELPGVKKEEIDLNINDDTLSIGVNKTEEVENDSFTFIHRERRITSMSRRVRLRGANLDQITASLNDGILIITIPKFLKQDTTKKIEIK